MIKRAIFRLGIMGLCFFACMAHAKKQTELLAKQVFTESDAVLVVEKGQGAVFDWRSSQQMIPASLTKLATAYTAIDKWSIDHAFHTDFYQLGDQLWVKGYGDPYLVSEELDLLVVELQKLDLDCIKSVHVDGIHFVTESVPGRSSVNDPYNAPLSAVAANFNTVKVSKKDGAVVSAEPQTPLTLTAQKIANHPTYGLPNIKVTTAERFNLRNRSNAQAHFAQLLAKKMAKPQWSVEVNQVLPSNAKHLYRYTNSHTLENIIQGMLEYSNNFMANQLFLNLASNVRNEPVSFSKAATYTEGKLTELFGWKGHRLVEGSGLSRSNRLSAQQIDDLLVKLEPYKGLFKKTAHPRASIRAKTGTLDGVRSFAGYIDFEQTSYRFAFLFNRKVPWRYREQLLTTLVDQLAEKQISHEP